MNETNLFARPIRVDAIPGGGLDLTIEADEAERAALARFDGLVAIGRLVAGFALKRESGGIVRVRGQIHAEVTQTCVVSLEPFDAIVDEPVDVRFAQPVGEAGRAREPGGKSPGLDDDDIPDPIVDGKIDLGALAAEFLVLGLDPYPRKPDAALARRAAGDPPVSSADDGGSAAQG